MNILNLQKKNVTLRRVAEFLCICLTTSDEVEKYVEMMQSSSSDNCVRHFNIKVLNLFDPDLQLTSTKLIIKNKLKELNGLKKFKVQTILVLECKKRNDHKIFHSSAKLIASDSDIKKRFKFMHQSIMTKIKNYASEH